MARDRREYANGTYLDSEYPFGLYVGGRVECPDGSVRQLKRIASTADTFFSVPAAVAVRGKTVSGFVTTETVSGLSTETEDDPGIARFKPFTYGKNGGAFG